MTCVCLRIGGNFSERPRREPFAALRLNRQFHSHETDVHGMLLGGFSVEIRAVRHRLDGTDVKSIGEASPNPVLDRRFG